MSEITPEIVAEHGLSGEEYQRILNILGRAPNLLELGIFSVMWSEHCSYKSSKHWLKKLPTEGPQVIQGPGENAGVVDIGDGQAVVFKMESHNHPSFIEPYQGAATGVGGILRDVFTMGARPVAILNALRFGDPSHAKTRHLVSGVVGGIGGYGNCVGVPTVGGECTFHRSYNGNILVNAMAVGLADQDKIFYAAAAGIGNPVLYVGAKTGRDGIHGATMASAEFSDATEAKRPTVQVGDPFMEKLLIEACLELMQQDCIVAIQDMGAAGLTSSSFEMAARGDAGIEMDLDRVPMRETGMVPYEIMLSESQERMLIVAKAGRERDAFAVFDKWGLDCAVVGKVTDSGRMVLRWHGETVADVPIPPIAGASPEYQRPIADSPLSLPLAASTVRVPHDLPTCLKTLIGSPDIASKRWIWEQYDHMVMADTVVRPGHGAAVVRVHGSNKALALSTDCTPRYVEADAKRGGMQAVVETWRNLIVTGAEPLAITDCMNFGNPEKPKIMGQFAGAIEGMAKACAALSFPVVSGNVSLYNETDGQAIQPTPAIGGVGLLDDLGHLIPAQYRQSGLDVLMLGETQGWLGCSLALRYLAGREEGAPPPIDLAIERRHGRFVQQLGRDRLILAADDISDGGLLVALTEMALRSGLGLGLDAPVVPVEPLEWWFGEDQARYIVVCDPEQRAAIQARADAAGVLVRRVAVTGGEALRLVDGEAISLEDLRTLHEGWLPAYMAAA